MPKYGAAQAVLNDQHEPATPTQHHDNTTGQIDELFDHRLPNEDPEAVDLDVRSTTAVADDLHRPSQPWIEVARCAESRRG